MGGCKINQQNRQSKIEKKNTIKIFVLYISFENKTFTGVYLRSHKIWRMVLGKQASDTPVRSMMGTLVSGTPVGNKTDKRVSGSKTEKDRLVLDSRALSGSKACQKPGRRLPKRRR